MRLLLSIACENGLGIDQLDVNPLYLDVTIKDEPSISLLPDNQSGKVQLDRLYLASISPSSTLHGCVACFATPETDSRHRDSYVRA
jgi:hypothetical protein